MRAMPRARVAFAAYAPHGNAMPEPLRSFETPSAAYLAGIRAAWLSVFAYVLFGTYIGIGALAYDFGFSLLWVCLSTLLVWAGPAQVILISALGGGAALIEVAIAVGIERRAPAADGGVPAAGPEDAADAPARSSPAGAFHRREHVGGIDAARAADRAGAPHRHSATGSATGYMVIGADRDGHRILSCRAVAAADDGGAFVPDADVVPGLGRAQQPRCWSTSSRSGLGLLIGPLLAYRDVDLDILWAGIGGGTLAYVVHRVRESLR